MVRKGTGFTNINRILQANRGSGLGSAVAGGITGQVQKVQSGVKSAQDQFQEDANKNRLDNDESKQKRENVLGRFNESNYNPNMANFSVSSGLQTGFDANKQKLEQEKTAQQAAQNQYNQSKAGVIDYDARLGELQTGYDKDKQSETEAYQKAERAKLVAANLPSDQEIKDFTKYRTGTYTGPAELGNAQSLIGDAQQAESLGGLARSSGGRQELLRQFVGGRDYTQGQRRLDETILGQDQAVNLGAAARKTRGAVEDVQEANRLAGNQAGEYRNRAREFGEETQRMIGETKNPVSGGVDQRIAQAQAAEAARLAKIKGIQETFTGTGAEFEGLDKMTRLGLGLQEAKDLGYLSDQDTNFLLGSGGKTGLLQRGMNLGLDVNSLLQERMKDVGAQNLNRTGVASDEDVARINALDRLMGKQGTDLEFRDDRAKFQAGKTNFDLRSLEDYITRAEQQKAASDSSYAGELENQKKSYLDQSLAYGGSALGGIKDLVGMDGSKLAGLGVLAAPGTAAALAGGFSGAGVAGTAAGFGAGAAAASPAALAAMIGVDMLTGSDSTAQSANALGQTGLSVAGATSQGQNALYEGMMKLNLGGTSIANTGVGKQLMKALEYKSKLENQTIGEGSKAMNEVTGKWGDVTSTARSNPTELAKYILSGGASAWAPTASRVGGNVAREVNNAIKKVTNTKGWKISDEDLKEEIDYNPEDVQKFLDRIKPAAYNYKEEVKDDPRASKNRELGVMAQDLEKSKLGKEAVHNTPEGKIVDYDNLEPKMLASLASLNERLKRIEGKK